jgi:hypothetical protein
MYRYYIMFLNINKPGIHIIIAASFVYIFVNIFENVIHYNIGKFSNREINFEFPSSDDWVKIIVVMCMFAILQGILTYFVNKI